MKGAGSMPVRSTKRADMNVSRSSSSCSQYQSDDSAVRLRKRASLYRSSRSAWVRAMKWPICRPIATPVLSSHSSGCWVSLWKNSSAPRTSSPSRMGNANAERRPDQSGLSGLKRGLRALGEERRNRGVAVAPGLLASEADPLVVQGPARPAGPAERLAERGEHARHGFGGGVGLREDARDPVLDRLALLGALAVGDVDDRADQPGDLSVGVGEGRLVVERMPRAPVGDLHLEFVAAGARVVPEVVVCRLVLRGDLWRAGKEL